MKTAALQFESLEPRLLLSAVPPVVTALTGLYDANTSASVVGRYIAGVAVTEKLGAKVTQASWSDPVVSVTFQLGSKQFVDTTSWDGWGFSFNVGTLTGDTPLVVTAKAKSGLTSTAYTGQVQVIPAPAWVSEMGGKITFSTTARAYTLSATTHVLQKEVAVPITCPIVGGKYASADLTLSIGATVPVSPTGAITTSLKGGLNVQMLCKMTISKTWTSPSAGFSGSLSLDPTTLAINSLSASYDYTGSSVVQGSLQNCPVATYLGVTGYLNMNTAADVAAACHYQAGTGVVVNAGSTMDVDSTATLTNGTINLLRPSNLPIILQYGISGTVSGTITQGLHATVPQDGDQEWTAPFTAHVTAKLSETSAFAIYLQQVLGWDTTKPTLLDYSADLANLTF